MSAMTPFAADLLVLFRRDLGAMAIPDLAQP